MSQPSQATVLQAQNVVRTFGKGANAVTALKGASLTVPRGSLVALKGRSGSGKTTLMNMLGGLDQPSSGTVWLEQTDLSKLSEKERNELRRRHVGLVFQSFALVPYMSAYENVEFGLRIAGVQASLRKEYAESALAAVGLKERMKHRPNEMSGGEQQRVAIARAVAHRPKLLLADEPTAELDSRMGLQVMKAFKELVEAHGMTILLTTHDPAIMEIVDHVFALEDGRIVES
ncbi:ABC transporter ATP-binding protein [Paenibacillus turpanensis]|uniref:ABC transporter ATP-binding protein n=1 Tax=Paenibacillus turpanensis TaxID=2689078 RepID=UPI001407E1E3|nr:ABC transporter ATP-binding protein [Paenibacillus turpanensis]